MQQCITNAVMHGSIAQLVEQRIENPRVAGSIPARATFFFSEKESAHVCGWKAHLSNRAVSLWCEADLWKT